MAAASLVLAGIAAAIHVLIFALESVLFLREDVFRRFGARSRDEADTLRLFAFNQGFYNLFLATGTVIGIAIAAGEEVGRDWMLVGFCCAFMVAAAVVLVASERRMLPAGLVQGLVPLVAVVLMAMS